MKIVINTCFGGFSVSNAVMKELGLECDGYGYLNNEDLGIPKDAEYDAYRSHPKLIEAIEKVGIPDANGRDFLVTDKRLRSHGSYISIRELHACAVKIRFCCLQKVVVYDPKMKLN
jgi:hypothetical protein